MLLRTRPEPLSHRGWDGLGVALRFGMGRCRRSRDPVATFGPRTPSLLCHPVGDGFHPPEDGRSRDGIGCRCLSIWGEGVRIGVETALYQEVGMNQYLLSIYQPDGPPPSPEVLGPIMEELQRVERGDAERLGSGCLRSGCIRRRRRLF